MNVTDLLDQLDALRNDATGAFPWRQNGPELSGIDDAEDLSVGCTWVARDAALIVAAVNSLPQLTAALRAVHALADELDGEHKRGCCAGGDCLLGGEHTHPDDPVLASELVGILSANPPPMRAHRMVPCPRECDCGARDRADRLRAVLAALAPDTTREEP